ncbi:MAG: 30S ribosomal protein S13 [Candidatus Pacearchaeota archaeon]
MEKQEIKEKSKEKEEIIRIASTDIPARLSVYAGLTKIKGISWSFSSAICNVLDIDKRKKISDLTEAEIEKINFLIKNPSSLPPWILNRRKDIETGQDRHLITAELDLQREFDIRRMKKIKCYKGIRHALGQPVRGQRTRSHFRKGQSIGVTRKKTAAKPASEKK